jgi:outer membrane protein assembly factor BamB
MALVSRDVIFPATVFIFGLFVFHWWLVGEAPESRLRLPGTDRVSAGVSTLREGLEFGHWQQGTGTPSPLPGCWPQFRGENHDNVIRSAVPLVREWRNSEPDILWKIELGEGYAAPVVYGGCVYILDYDQEKREDALRCLSLEDGAEIWRYAYPVNVKRNHGMSRTMPAVDENYVVALGPKCHVICLERKTGRLLWGLDLARDYGATVPQWYAGQCPLLADGKTVLAPGGKELLIAVDCASGKVVWKTENPGGWEMTHASILPIEFSGRKMLVYAATGGVAGVSPEDGKILWQSAAWKGRVIVPTPVDLGEGKLFFSGGYNLGSVMLQLREEKGNFVAEETARLAPEVFAAEQQTPVFYNNHIYGTSYGVRPKGQLLCLDMAGKVQWQSGETFGLGPFIIADGVIYILDDFGNLSTVEATPSAYRKISGCRILEGHDSWGPLVLVEGRLLARDLTRMVCVDLREKK